MESFFSVIVSHSDSLILQIYMKINLENNSLKVDIPYELKNISFLKSNIALFDELLTKFSDHLCSPDAN